MIGIHIQKENDSQIRPVMKSQRDFGLFRSSGEFKRVIRLSAEIAFADSFYGYISGKKYIRLKLIGMHFSLGEATPQFKERATG